MKNLLAFLIIFGVFSSCAVERQYEKYGDIRAPGNQILTQAKHPHGWARNDCFYCHVRSNFHQVDTVGSGMLDFAETLIDRDGEASCALSACHGSNGAN